jgi:hypothetical protein
VNNHLNILRIRFVTRLTKLVDIIRHSPSAAPIGRPSALIWRNGDGQPDSPDPLRSEDEFSDEDIDEFIVGYDWCKIEGRYKIPSEEDLKAFNEQVSDLMPSGREGERFTPRNGQTYALYNLCVNRKDTILIAKTGYGKSIIFQLAPLLVGGVVLIISPLRALSDDQKANLDGVPGAKPLVIDGDNNNAIKRGVAVNGDITHCEYHLLFALTFGFPDAEYSNHQP